jgi:hypothetical protein
MTPAALAANKANAQKAGRPKGKIIEWLRSSVVLWRAVPCYDVVQCVVPCGETTLGPSHHRC